MALAARGARNLDAGVEPVPETGSVESLRRRSRRIYLQSLAVALLLVALWLLVPE